MYGNGATESAIEHRFRTVRRQANELRNNAREGTGPAPQPRARIRRPTRPDAAADISTARSGQKRSARNGKSTKESQASTDANNPIAADGSDQEEDANNASVKRTKTETMSPTAFSRNLLPNFSTERTALFPSQSNGYELAPTGPSTNAHEQQTGFFDSHSNSYYLAPTGASSNAHEQQDELAERGPWPDHMGPVFHDYPEL